MKEDTLSKLLIGGAVNSKVESKGEQRVSHGAADLLDPTSDKHIVDLLPTS